jgi:hypothetical protein
MCASEFGHERRLQWVINHYSRRLKYSDKVHTFPTDGKPTNPTDAIPVLATSNPRPPPPPPLVEGEMSSRLSLASFALSWPK